MRRAPLLGLLTGAALAASVTPAQGGTYEVVSCADAPGGANNAWVTSNNSPAKLAMRTACPPNGDFYGGLAVTDLLGSGSNVAPGSRAQWIFTAPAGTTITRWQYDRRIGKYEDDGWFPYAALGDGTVLDTCSIVLLADQCQVGGVFGSAQSPHDATGLSQTSLTFGAECAATGGSTCNTGATIQDVWASLYASSVTLSENTDPNVGAPSGALTGAGWHSGSAGIGFTASDASPGVGIKETRVYVDGVSRSSNVAPTGDPSSGSEWECDFTYAKPCSDAGSVSHTIDTTALADGLHQLHGVAIDAAGNDAESSEVAINVDNGAPSSQVAVPGGTQASTAIPVSWSASDGSGSGVASYDVEVSVDGGAWQAWLTGADSTSAPYVGATGPRYAFRVRARDGLGHVGGWATSTTTAISTPTIANPVAPVGPEAPPATDGDGSGRASISRLTPSLRVRIARRRGYRLTISGTISSEATGRLRVTWSGRVAGRRRRLVRWARISNGRFRIAMRAPGRGEITMRYAGDARFAPRSVRTRT